MTKPIISGLALCTLVIFNACGETADGEAAKEEQPPVQEADVNKTAPYPISGENTLYLESSVVEAQTGADEIEAVNGHLRWPTKDLTLLADQMTTTAVNSFPGLAPAAPAGCTDYVTGVRIHLGAISGVAGYEMKLLYQPVRLCKDSDSTSNGTTFRKYIPVDGACYEYNDGTLSVCTSSAQYFADYKAHIQITENGQTRGYQNGDVTSMIYSCQELLAVVRDDDSPSPSLKLWNCIRRVPPTGTPYSDKHSILLSGSAPDVEPGTKKLSSFRGKYANLSHLCPPSCNVTPVMYRLQ